MKHLKSYENNNDLKKYIIYEILNNSLDVYEIGDYYEFKYNDAITEKQVKLYLWYMYNTVKDELKNYHAFKAYRIRLDEFNSRKKYIKFQSNSLDDCLEYIEMIKNINKYNL